MTPWERRKRAREQQASDPYGDPYTIEGPERQAPPQTAPQAERDRQQVATGQYDIQRGPYQVQRESLGVTADQLAIEERRQKLEQGPQFTDGQSKAAGFLRRALGAAREFDGTGVGPMPVGTAIGNAISQDFMNKLSPDWGGNSDERERANMAIWEFTNAIMRRDSGATTPDPEIGRYMGMFYPQSEAGVEQARAARKRALQALMGEAGGALDAQQPGLRGELEAYLNGGQVDPAAPAMAPPSVGPPPQQRGPERMTSVDRPVYNPGELGMEVNQGKTGKQTIYDPAMDGVNRRLSDMLMGGASDGDILKFLVSVGIKPQNTNIQQALRARRTPGIKNWIKQNRGKQPWPSSLGVREVEMGAVDRARARLSSSAAGAYGMAAGQVVTGNHLDNLVEAAGGDGDLANFGMQQVRQNHPYASLAGDVSGGAGLYGIGRKVTTRVASKLPAWAKSAVAGDAATGAYIGSGASGTDIINPKSTAGGAAIGTGAGVAVRGGARALSPTGGKLAPIYAEGGQPSLGQRMGGVVNRAEQAFANVPILGGVQRSTRNRAVDQAQRGAFNTALREIGENLPDNITKGTGAHAYMQRAFNRVYDRARSAMSFRPDGQWTQDLGAIQQEVALLQPGSQQVFASMVKPIGVRLQGRGGMLNGDDYKTFSSRIGAKVRALRKNPTGDHELAEALERLSVALDDGARRHSSPQAAALLDAADRGYVKSVIIENAARGAGEAGEFSGAALENAIKNGAGGLRARVFLRGEAPMQDYAAAMKRLGPSVADSGSMERFMTLGGMGSLAHFIDPMMLAPYGANTAANLPGIRSAVNAALAPNRPALAPVRDQIMNRRAIPGLFGAPLIESQFGP